MFALRRKVTAPVALPEVPEVQAADVAEDSAAAEAAEAAREDAAAEAQTGWARDRTRKLPKFGGPLILALVLGAWAVPFPTLGRCEETPKNAPPGGENGPALATPAPEGCLRLTGPFLADTGRAPGGPPRFGFWIENGEAWICPCFQRPAEFGEVTMVPGGCQIPEALPLIALRPEGWAYVTGGIAKSNSEIASLRDQRDAARDQRDVALQESGNLGRYNGQLIEERDAARKSLFQGIGGGALAGAIVTGLIVYLAGR